MISNYKGKKKLWEKKIYIYSKVKPQKHIQKCVSDRRWQMDFFGLEEVKQMLSKANNPPQISLPWQ